MHLKELHPEPDHASAIPDLGQSNYCSLSQETVQYGSISSLKKQWGFIRPVGSALDVFFHFSNLEAGQTPADLQVSQPVQYVLSKDLKTGRPCAISVAITTVEAVQHEDVSPDCCFGYVLRWPSCQHQAVLSESNQGSGSTVDSIHPQCGIIRYIDTNGKPTHVTFTADNLQLQQPDNLYATTSANPTLGSSQHGDGQASLQHGTARESADTALHEGQNHVPLLKGNPWVVFKLCCSKHLKQQGSHARGAKSGYRAVQVCQLTDWADITTSHPEWALHFQILQTLALAQL